MGIALFGLGRVALARGDPAQAGARLRESLALRRSLGDAAGAAHCLDELAAVALARGDPAGAARRFGAAAELQERTGAAPWPPGAAARARALAATRAALGPAAFAAAWAAGAAMRLEQAVADALEEVPDGPDGRRV